MAKLSSQRLIIALCFIVQSLSAYNWSAKWIWQENNSGDTWVCFRKSFTLNESPSTAVANIAVDSKYWLYVNDVLVVREGGLKRGPNPNDTYYDEVNIASYLSSGNNTIAILATYWGVPGFSHQSSGMAGLLFQLDMPEKNVISDASWKILRHPAFGSSSSQPNYRISERSVRFNGALDIPDWYKKAFSDAGFGAAVEKGQPPCSPWNQLVKRPIPQWKDGGVSSYASLSASLPATGSLTFFANLPRNIQCQPIVTLTSSTPGGTVTISSATNDEQNLKAEYVSKGDGSVETFEVPIWLNGDAIRYEASSGITVQSVQYRETGYAADLTGSFRCSDASLNRLWIKSANTLAVCMRDNYFDCPDRERAQWWGDAVVEIGQTFYAMDRRADLLSAKAISELMNWQRGDYTIFSPMPAGNWSNELPVQMLCSIGQEGFWNYYMHTNDASTLTAVYEKVKNYLSVWSLNGDGLVNHRNGGWDWTDWGTHIDVRVLDNCWYQLAVKAAYKMAVLAGATSDTAHYSSILQSLEANFNRVYWDAANRCYRDPGFALPGDDRANAMAVICGFADTSKWADITSVLSNSFYAGTWMEKWVEESLFMMGQDNAALIRMRNRYSSMVGSSSSTLWEFFPTGGTPNHSWSGGPLTLMSQYVTGIAPEIPGYSRFHVLPQMGNLDSAAASVPSIKGEIVVGIIKRSNQTELTVHVPNGTEAIIGIPKDNSNITAVSVNNSTVWADNIYLGGVSGVNYFGQDDKFIKFLASSGDWHFVGQVTRIIIPVQPVIQIAADDTFEVYLNGARIASANGWQIKRVINPVFQKSNTLAVMCHNNTGQGGLLAEILGSSGQQYGTSTGWKVSLDAPEGWKESDFNDAGWPSATELGAYGMSPWGTTHQFDLNTPANWIWWSSAADNQNVYFRYNFVFDTLLTTGVKRTALMANSLSVSGAPNPFKSMLSLDFNVPDNEKIHLAVYSLNGQKVRALTEGVYRPGRHQTQWDGMDAQGRKATSGIYVIKLTAGKRSVTKKIALSR